MLAQEGQLPPLVLVLTKMATRALPHRSYKGAQPSLMPLEEVEDQAMQAQIQYQEDLLVEVQLQFIPVLLWEVAISLQGLMVTLVE